MDQEQKCKAARLPVSLHARVAYMRVIETQFDAPSQSLLSVFIAILGAQRFAGHAWSKSAELIRFLVSTIQTLTSQSTLPGALLLVCLLHPRLLLVDYPLLRRTFFPIDTHPHLQRHQQDAGRYGKTNQVRRLRSQNDRR